jgi:hypothetical protein
MTAECSGVCGRHRGSTIICEDGDACAAPLPSLLATASMYRLYCANVVFSVSADRLLRTCSDVVGKASAAGRRRGGVSNSNWHLVSNVQACCKHTTIEECSGEHFGNKRGRHANVQVQQHGPHLGCSKFEITKQIPKAPTVPLVECRSREPEQPTLERQPNRVSDDLFFWAICVALRDTVIYAES